MAKRLSDHNARISRERESAPVLPPHWGSSFTRVPGRPRTPRLSAASAADLLSAVPGEADVERMLGFLHALAARGRGLPAMSVLAELFDGGSDDYGRRLLLALARRGDIELRHVGGQRGFVRGFEVVLRANGGVVPSSGLVTA